MKILKKFFKSNLEMTLLIYIGVSVLIHILYNIYFKDLKFVYDYYTDSPFFTINNILVLLFNFISSLLNIDAVSIIDSLLKFLTSINREIFDFILNIPYLSYLVEALNWVIMYILFIVLGAIILAKKLFSITIKVSVVIGIIYLIYSMFYQYTLSNKYDDLDYVSRELYEDCICVEVEVTSVVDGDTIKVIYKGEEVTVRLLYIDTPEATKEVEVYGYEATDTLKSFINNADSVYLEFDGAREDKYGRLLAWVWVDDLLVQEVLTKIGLVEDFYDYGNYKYEDIINNAMNYAKDNDVKIHKK